MKQNLEWICEIEDGFLNNPNLTGLERKCFHSVKDLLCDSDWFDYEKVRKRIATFRIERESDYEVPVYKKKQNVLYLKEPFLLSDYLYLVCISGISKLEQLNQVYVSYKRKLKDTDTTYFEMLYDFCDADDIDGAFITGNVMLIMKSFYPVLGLKKAEKLLDDLNDCYLHRYLNEERIEKIVAQEEFMKGIQKMRDARL